MLKLEGVIRGLEYLHDNNVVHGDIRGVRASAPAEARAVSFFTELIHQANVFIGGADGGKAVLADFGLAIPFDEYSSVAHTATGSVGSTRWQAPELHDPDQYGLKEAQRTQASDIYSFGCLCLEVRAYCSFNLS
jgi:serine/threonine protein kinase